MFRCNKRITRKQAFMSTVVLVFFIIVVKLYNEIGSSSSGNFQPHLDVGDVQDLLYVGEETGVVVTLFDPIILQAWHSNLHIKSIGSCLFLCHVVGPLSFAITEVNLREKPQFLSRLAQLGFTVTQFFNADEQKSHIYLIRHGSPLHVSVLHWRNAGYWRQYRLYGPPHIISVVKQFITVESWNILNMERAYERFGTRQAVIDGLKMNVPSNIEAFVTDHKNAHFIPCNKTQASYFYLKFNQIESPESLRFEHLAWKLLAKSKTTLDQLGIPFWLSSGTCLGFFRQCKIIPWSMDVDFGIFIEDYNPRLIQKFEDVGLKLIHQFGKVEDSFELSFKENEIKLDLFFFYTEGATMWNGGTQARTGKKFKYVFPAFTMCWTEFLELKVRIPCQTKDYIEANYGKNWLTPIKNWDWKSSPANVQDNGVWPQEMLDKVIIIKNT